MKRRVSVVFVVLVLMAVFSSTVFAAPAQNGKSVTLVSIKYLSSGVVLMFETSGLAENDLKNRTFFAHSSEQNIYCNFVSDTTNVRCLLAKKLAEYQGESFSGTLAGFSFEGTFPKNTYCAEGEILWYSIDVFNNGVFSHSFQIPAWSWDNGIAGGLGITTFEITKAFCSNTYYGPN